jgi:hypothetical protein
MTQHKIFKYIIPIKDKVILVLPINSELLSVKEQYNKIVLYVEHTVGFPEFDDVLVRYTIRVVGTGNPYSFNRALYKFWDTVKTEDGQLMWHIFVRSCWQSLDEPEDE